MYLAKFAQNVFPRSCKCTTSQRVLYIGIWSKTQQIHLDMPLEIGVYLPKNHKSLIEKHVFFNLFLLTNIVEKMSFSTQIVGILTSFNYIS
jgi:hypothetical protein